MYLVIHLRICALTDSDSAYCDAQVFLQLVYDRQAHCDCFYDDDLQTENSPYRVRSSGRYVPVSLIKAASVGESGGRVSEEVVMRQTLSNHGPLLSPERRAASIVRRLTTICRQ